MHLQTKQDFKLDEFESSTVLVLKVYGIERKTLAIKSIGFSLLNIFEPALEGGQPTEDGAVPTSWHLNQGAFQLPIYPGKMNVNEVLAQQKYTKYKRWPCSTLLVRVGPILDAQDDFPLYKDGIYDSTACVPDNKEAQLYLDLLDNKSELTYRGALEETDVQFQVRIVMRTFLL